MTQGDNLFAQLKYGMDTKVSQGNFVANFVLGKIDLFLSNCHCVGGNPCDKELLTKINQYKNVLWKD